MLYYQRPYRAKNMVPNRVSEDGESAERSGLAREPLTKR
jgi:hypothetical protein